MNIFWQAVTGIALSIIAGFTAADYYRSVRLTKKLDKQRVENKRGGVFPYSGIVPSKTISNHEGPVTSCSCSIENAGYAKQAPDSMV